MELRGSNLGAFDKGKALWRSHTISNDTRVLCAVGFIKKKLLRLTVDTICIVYKAE